MASKSTANSVVSGSAQRRAAANRRNARRSTGPKSTAGKAAVARNSTAHGIYALSPVVKDAESPEEWQEYRNAMLQSLAPEGMLEETLAERLILNAWRLRRVTRYETGEIDAAIVWAKEKKWDMREDALLHYRKRIIDCAIAGKHGQNEITAEAKWALELAFSHCEEKKYFGEVQGQKNAPIPLEEYCDALGDDTFCTTSKFLEVLERMAAQFQIKTADLLELMQRDISQEVSESQQKLMAIQSAGLVPQPTHMEKIMRYESHLSRMFNRDLHELQRLQALRKGQPVAAPFVLDVNLPEGVG